MITSDSQGLELRWIRSHRPESNLAILRWDVGAIPHVAPAVKTEMWQKWALIFDEQQAGLLNV